MGHHYCRSHCMTLISNPILVPRIDSTTTISEGERKIIVSYSLKHTGGYNPNDTSIGVICGKTNSLSLPTMTTSIGSGDSNAYLLDDNYIECMSNCLDNNRRGTLDVDGLLTAGVSYICVVVAGNEEGEFYYNTTSLIASIGLFENILFIFYFKYYIIPRCMCGQYLLTWS